MDILWRLDLAGTPALTPHCPEPGFMVSSSPQHVDVWRALLVTVMLAGRLQRSLEMVISKVSRLEVQIWA